MTSREGEVESREVLGEATHVGGHAVVPPSFRQTFKWADGDSIGDFGWMTDIDYFESDVEDAMHPREVLVETWERTNVEVKTLFPQLYDCHYEDDERCEEDAVAWQQKDADTDHPVWMAACEKHRHLTTPAARATEVCPKCGSTKVEVVEGQTPPKVCLACGDQWAGRYGPVAAASGSEADRG